MLENLKLPVEWAKSVVSRDCRCLDCGNQGDLHAFRIDPAKPLDLTNGATLCTSCRSARYAKRRYASRQAQAEQSRAARERARILDKIADLEWRIRCLRDLLK